MARLYRTDSAMPIDYMYRQNTPLMQQVMLKNDEYITDNLAQLGRIGDAAASFNYLTPDNKRANEIVQGYTSQIDDLTEAIRSDPASWRNQIGKIRDVANDLKKNYKVGEISKIAGNYNTYKQASDYIDAQVESYNKGKEGISAEEGQAFKNKFLSEFGGTNFKSPTEYGSIKAFNPGNTINLEKFLGEELDKIKADKKSWKKDEVTGGDMYFNQKSGSWEGVTPEKILEIVTDRSRNPIVQNYLRERSQAGIINNAYDASGNLLKPFDIEVREASPEQQQAINGMKKMIEKERNPQKKAQLEAQLTNYSQRVEAANSGLSWQNPDGSDRSILSPVMRGLVAKNSYSQTNEEDTLKNNSVWNTRYTQAGADRRQRNQLAAQREMFNIKEQNAKDKFNERLTFDKYKWDNPHATGKAATTAKGKDGKEIPQEESSVSRIATNSFEDMWVTDQNGQRLKKYSAAGLAADLDQSKKAVSEVDTKLKSVQKGVEDFERLYDVHNLNTLPLDVQNQYNSLVVQRNDLQQAKNKLDSDVNESRQWYKNTVDAVLNNNYSSIPEGEAPLSPEELKLYKKYEGDRQAQDLARKIEQTNMSLGDVMQQNNLSTFSAEKALNQIKNVGYRDEMKKYLKVKQKVDQRRDYFLGGIRSTPIDTDAVKLGSKDTEAVADMIFNDPKGMELFTDRGENAKGVSLDSKGLSFPAGKDNRTLSFEGGELQKYIAENDVKVHINKIGNSTKIGKGNAVAEVTFDDPTGQMGKAPYYIALTPHVQKTIATRLLHNNKDPEIQKLSSDLLDDEMTSLRNQLITPSSNKNTGKTNANEPIVKTIYVDDGDTKVPFHVTYYTGEDGTHLNVTLTQNGKEVPTPFGSAGMPGFFKGPDDFIQQYKAYKKANSPK